MIWFDLNLGPIWPSMKSIQKNNIVTDYRKKNCIVSATLIWWTAKQGTQQEHNRNRRVFFNYRLMCMMGNTANFLKSCFLFKLVFLLKSTKDCTISSRLNQGRERNVSKKHLPADEMLFRSVDRYGQRPHKGGSQKDTVRTKKPLTVHQRSVGDSAITVSLWQTSKKQQRKKS